MALTRDDLLKAYRLMRTIREFEERVHVEFAAGEIEGFVHLYAGEEACAVGVMLHLTKADRIASTHRGHGHCIAKGVDVPAMMAEIYGRATGSCRGKGGSMHIADLDAGMMGANGIVGGGPPLICGAALAAKVQGTREVGVAFIGDGASNQGTTFESMNLATVWNLPAIFVAENNGYAEATAADYAIGAGSLADRAEGFGMPAATVDGHDFFAVHQAAGEAIGRARAGDGPSFIECQVNRYYGHYEGDAQTYRPPGEAEAARANHDCLDMFAGRVTKSAGIEREELDDIDRAVAALIDGAVSSAKADPAPAAADYLTDVYVDY